MDQKGYNIKVIGLALAILYAALSLMFIQYLNIPGFKVPAGIYLILFGILCVSAIASMALIEWGRKLLMALNMVIMLAFILYYIPKVDLVHLIYFMISMIVVMYFNQPAVKRQFEAQKFRAWHKSILVVDDDETMLKTLRPILLSHGYSVLTANTGEDGLRIANMQKPDLIFLDVILPGIKGRGVCQKLKENPKTQNIPVVFLTAKNSPDDIEAEKDAGALGHITKPVDSQILIATVQDILGAKGERKRA